MNTSRDLELGLVLNFKNGKRVASLKAKSLAKETSQAGIWMNMRQWIKECKTFGIQSKIFTLWFIW